MAFVQPTDAALFGLLGLLAALALGTLYWQLALRARVFDLDPGWLESFDPARYEPMARLLDAGELDFLREETGQSEREIRQVRKRRVRIFQTYLEELSADFSRLQTSGRLLLANGSAPAGFNEELFRAQVRFTRAMWGVRFQTTAFRLGLRSVNTAELLDSFARFSELTRQLAITPSAA